jgi:hypothetical protein
MKQRLRLNLLMLQLTVALLTVTMAPACAQDLVKKEPRGVQLGGSNQPAMTTAQMNVAKATVENSQRKLLDELLEPETAQQTKQSGKAEPCALAECTSTPLTGGITHE